MQGGNVLLWALSARASSGPDWRLRKKGGSFLKGFLPPTYLMQWLLPGIMGAIRNIDTDSGIRSFSATAFLSTPKTKLYSFRPEIKLNHITGCLKRVWDLGSVGRSVRLLGSLCHYHTRPTDHHQYHQYHHFIYLITFCTTFRVRPILFRHSYPYQASIAYTLW